MKGLRDVAGGQGLHFFQIVPPFVDAAKPPGRSEIPAPTLRSWVMDAVTLRHIWASPNLVWSAMALGVYFLFPYDLSPRGVAARAPLSSAFFWERLPLWLVLVLGYNSFWHCTLYLLQWGKRPFVTNRRYNLSKVLHNVSYCSTGIAIWTGFENVFAFLWATGRLPFLPDEVALGSAAGLCYFVGGLVAIPLWRDVHFYWAHRFLHFRPLYKHVHSLHHRNTDVEPFSGLCMHPVEHLYYYACVLPSLLVAASPFHFLWNGVHLLLSPGASHSGFEDHWQADGYHYMHHRYFECNYAGTPAGVLDVVFGTFQPRFKDGDSGAAREDAKSTLLGALQGAQLRDFVAYLVLSSACLVPWAAAAGGLLPLGPSGAQAVSLLAGTGPVAVACLMSLDGGWRGLLKPFDEKPLWESAVHILLGLAFCGWPITAACRLSL